ncbi:MAG TPA: anaerobic ribonucleoside-triphosphate reductase [Candidatus Hydrogenedentes bacterium]|nr:anaerobic ribonucleoside-triphosphate reductase [Candidatus Hydrogenedentota bacterium]
MKNGSMVWARSSIGLCTSWQRVQSSPSPREAVPDQGLLWTVWWATLGVVFRAAYRILCGVDVDYLDADILESHDAEGAYDDQLRFTAFVGEVSEPIASVTKRDGRQEAFDKRKIAGAIFKAAQSIGGTDRDRAGHLADAVAIYLAKRYNGGTTSVDQVHDAVEKVLIEMGHARTALAYVRYRDRRERIRRFREGDTRALLGELAQARHESALLGGGGQATLSVRTSAGSVVRWNRQRIVDALVRETGLDEGLANVIALEVEQQIQAAKVQPLSASLIRELVGARLVEHGLDEHCRRQMRLGVPVFDAERIVAGPYAGDPPISPVGTDLILAESVKREFALTQVFSDDVAEAHLRGDIHIHDLGFVDRLHTTVQSLEYIKRFGIGLSGSRSVSHPPRRPETLVAQMVHLNTALQAHYAGPVTWHALNVYLAPFLEDLDDVSMRQVAQSALFEFAHRAAALGERVPPAEVSLDWDIPPRLRAIEAVGPGGEYTGKSYGDYAHQAQQFAWAFLDVYREGGVGGISFPAPIPLVHIGPGFFHSPGHERFLEHVSNVIAQRGEIHILFDRASFNAFESDEVWQPLCNSVQCVSMNLPRAAYRAGSVPKLFDELDRLAEVVVRAHHAKLVFIERLLRQRSLGPLALLAVEREGKPFLDMARASFCVGVTGLSECVKALTDSELHESPRAQALGQHIVEHLSGCFAAHSERVDLCFVLAQATDSAVAQRLAALDVYEYPERTRRVAKTDRRRHALLYTPGGQINADASCNPMERVRIEGELHGWLGRGAVTRVAIPEDETATETIAGFLAKAFHQTQTHRIALCGG